MKSSGSKGSGAEGRGESYLAKLYTTQPQTLPEDIKDYVRSPENVECEIEYLLRSIGHKGTDLSRLIFVTEIVGKSIKKHSEFREYVKVLVNMMETYKDYRHSVFCLRVIKLVVSSRFYVPVSFYLLRILGNAITSRNIAPLNRKVSYDTISPGEDVVRSEEHQMFVIKEVHVLLMQHLSVFSKNIGFPELASVVINELKRLRIGIYREFVNDMISTVSKHRDHIIEKRSSLKLKGLDGTAISSFEGCIDRTL